MKNYDLIVALDPYKLVELTNEMLDKGYLLAGGLAVEMDNDKKFRYFQAVYLPEKS